MPPGLSHFEPLTKFRLGLDAVASFGIDSIGRRDTLESLSDLRAATLEDRWGTVFGVYLAITESRKGLVERQALFRLSYKIPPCHDLKMSRESKWKSRAIALEFWLLKLLVAGSFVAGLVSAVRYLLGR